jgi:hypothetical protein
VHVDIRPLHIYINRWYKRVLYLEIIAWLCLYSLLN